MKKIVSMLMVVVLLCAAFGSIGASAAAWPSLGLYSYCEIIAPKTINVYTSMYLNTRGTSSPAKNYNAYIDKGDVCKIYRIESNYIHLAYPTSSGYKQAFARRSDMFNVSSPSGYFVSKGKVTTYKYSGSSSYGYVAKGDRVYKAGTSGSYTNIIYQAKSGNRAYKAGWVKSSDYNNIIIGNSTPAPQPSTSSSLRFPLKGAITRSSSVKTNGYYCDYKTGGEVPVYAPANGTVVYKQAYRNTSSGKKLSSYGNFIEFTSADGVYKVKCCHLSSFVGATPTVTRSLSYPCSGSDSTIKRGTKTVTQGQIIGYSGMTGNASGHHLHIEVYKNGKAVNPANVFKTW